MAACTWGISSQTKLGGSLERNIAALLIFSGKIFVEYAQEVAALLVECPAISGSEIELSQLGIKKKSKQIHLQMKPNFTIQ